MADKLEALLGLNTEAFQRGIDAAKGKMRELGKVSKRIGSAIFSAISGPLAGLLGLAAVKNLINQFDELGKRAKDLNMSAGALFGVQDAAQHANIPLEKLNIGLNKINKSYVLANKGVKEQKNLFDSLGVSLRNANGSTKKTDQLLVEMAKGFENTTSSVDKMNIAIKMFGEEDASKMLRLFEEGEVGMRKFTESAKELDDAARAAATLNDAFTSCMNFMVKGAARAIGTFQILGDEISDLFNGRGSGYTQYKRLQDEMNKETSKALVEQAQYYDETLKRLNKASDALDYYYNSLLEYKRAERQADKELKQAKKELEKISQNQNRAMGEYEAAMACIFEKELAYNKAKEKLDKANSDRQKERNKLLGDELKILDDIKKTRKELMNLVATKGSGQNSSKMKRSQNYRSKADKAKADGRMNDYFKYTERADKLESEATDKRKGDLQKLGKDALRKGDHKTFNKLKDEYSKEGFMPSKKQNEELKNIEDSLRKLVGVSATVENVLNGK